MVLSEYGTRAGVRRNDDGFVRARKQLHRGVDFKAWVVGDPVSAAADGEVMKLSLDECEGVRVLISHSSWRRFTYYIHLQKASVEVGDHVRRGDVIGEVGLYPCSDEVVHVHMEVWNAELQPRADDDLLGTENPLNYSAGCFDRRKAYPTDRLVLTYPVSC